MLNDRQFASRSILSWIDPLGVILFIVITIGVLSSISLLYLSYKNDIERTAFQKECVDAGGVPVVTYTYIKGSKDGRLCINPSAIVELKDEK